MAGENFAAPLFATAGPDGFKESLTGIATAVGGVSTAFKKMITDVGTQLDGLNAKLDLVLSKTKQLGAGGGGGGGGVGGWLTGKLSPGTSSNTTGNGGGGQSGGISSMTNIPMGGVEPTGNGQLNFTGFKDGNNYTAGTQIDGAPGSGAGAFNFSPARLGVGLGVAAAGAAVRAGNGQVANGMSWSQLAFGNAAALGNSTNAAGQAKTLAYFQQFKNGYGGNISDLQGASNALQGGIVGPVGGKNFTNAMQNSGMFSAFGQANGVGINMTQSAQALQSVAGTRPGQAFLGAIGMGGVAKDQLSLFNVAQGTLGTLEKQHGIKAGSLNGQALASQTGLLSTFTNQMTAQAGISAPVAQTMIKYLEDQPKGGAANPTYASLGLKSSTLAQDQQAQTKTLNAQQPLAQGAASGQTTKDQATAAAFQAASKGFAASVEKFGGWVSGLTGGGAGGTVHTIGDIAGGVAGEKIAAKVGKKVVSKFKKPTRSIPKKASDAGGGGDAGGDAAVDTGVDTASDAADAGAAGADFALPAALLAGAGIAAYNIATGQESAEGKKLNQMWASGQKKQVMAILQQNSNRVMGVPGITSPSRNWFNQLPTQGSGGASGAGAPGNSGSSAASANGVSSTAPGASGTTVVTDAEKFLGVPYRTGGASPTGFDCSGLTMFAYNEVGVQLPHNANAQSKLGTAVNSVADLQPGDLVFYAGSDGSAGAPGHVGMYVGGGKMVDAPHTGTKVRYDPVGNPVAMRRYLAGNGQGAGASNNGGTSSSVSVSSAVGSSLIAAVNSPMGEGNAISESQALSSGLTPTFSGGVGFAAAPPTVATNGSSGAASTTAPAAGGSGGALSVAGAPATMKAWATLLLQDMKAPTSSTNIANIMDWMMSESSGLGTRNNPLNSAIDTGTVNGTKGYSSLNLAAHLDAYQLMPSSAGGPSPSYYTAIYNDLMASAPYAQFKADVVKSPWAGSHYAGGADFSHSYDKGSQYIETDQMAQLHKGEMVVRAGTAGAMRMNQMSATSGGASITVAKGAVTFVLPATGGSSATSISNQDMETMADKFWAAVQRKQSFLNVGGD